MITNIETDSYSKKMFLKKFVILFVIFVTFALIIIGIKTDLRYSDEIFHYWFAQDWYETGTRPVYNKLVDTLDKTEYKRYYINAPLWHFVLHNLFSISPQHKKSVAQIYQVFFYLMLIAGTYLLSRELYDDEVALYSVLIVGSIPLFLAFSVILFIDLPIAAFSPFLFLFLIKRKYLIVGLILGLMFLTKRNSYLLAPSVIIIYLVNNFNFPIPNYRKALYSVTIIILIVFALNIDDLMFRYHNFNGLVAAGDQGDILKSISLEDAGKAQKKVDVSNIYFSESVTRPQNFLRYIGIPILILLLSYLLYIKSLFQRRDIILIITIVLYIVFYQHFFRRYYAVRYLSPIIPLAVPLAAKGMKTISRKRKLLGIMIVALCVIQTVVVLKFVYDKRHISNDERAALNYISERIGEKSRILTTEELFLSYYTLKPTVWMNSFKGGVLYDLLWGDDTKNKIALLKHYNIKYIYIPKYRIYDDSKVMHYGGFPVTFMNILPAIARIEYSNKTVQLWRVSQ